MTNQSLVIGVTTGVFFVGCVAAEGDVSRTDNTKNMSVQNQQTMMQDLVFHQQVSPVNKIKSG